MNEMINAEKLYKEIELFKKWADENYPDWSEENDNGDWVMEEQSHFREMCDAVMEIIKTRDPYEDDEIMANAVLFAIARDNECEQIISELAKHENWFELLAEKSICSKYINAEWQFAGHLNECVSCDRELYFQFVRSENEYTSRLALRSMSKIMPETAEKYAVEFWNRGKYPLGSFEDEYQKIMALSVLYETGSAKLEEYLNKALESDYIYLVKNAEDIINKRHKKFL